MSKFLEFTGERFTPECVREIWYEHYHRYAFARNLVAGRTVLDAACGEGYGAALLATVATSVHGVDISDEAIDHANSRYSNDNLHFVASDCLAMPFPEAEFDCIVSFETLEHLRDHRGLMNEFRRVLRPGGFLIISSPDKAVYSDKQNNRNEYHVRELYRDEFESLLGEHFPAFRLWGQKLLFQSAIWSLEEGDGISFQQEFNGDVSEYPKPVYDPVYFIALCAECEDDLPLTDAAVSLFADQAESVYEHYYHEIRKNMAAGELLKDKEEEIAALNARFERARTGTRWWNRLLGRF